MNRLSNEDRQRVHTPRCDAFGLQSSNPKPYKQPMSTTAPLEITGLNAEWPPPWIENPFRLVSWFDMEKYSAEEFISIGRDLGTLRGMGVMVNHDNPDVDMRTITLEFVAPILDEIKTVSERLFLNVTAGLVSQLKSDLKETMKFVRFNDALNNIAKVIQLEMKSRLFLYVPPERAEYYNPKEPIFGQKVLDNFPSADFDIKEAGNCMAVGRYSACVFHLSRVIECLLSVIDADLGIVAKNTTWNYYITGVQSKAVDKYSDATNPSHKTMRSFYAGMSNFLRDAKDAWRDDNTHDPRRVFIEEEAKNLILSVRALMQHASNHLKETP